MHQHSGGVEGQRSQAGAAFALAPTLDHPVRMPWCVYLLRCGDGTLYCGTTNDLAARLAAHRTGRGARYTRGRGPLEVVFVERARGRGPALSREAALKRLSRQAKQALAAGWRGGGLTPPARRRYQRARPRPSASAS